METGGTIGVEKATDAALPYVLKVPRYAMVLTTAETVRMRMDAELIPSLCFHCKSFLWTQIKVIVPKKITGSVQCLFF